MNARKIIPSSTADAARDEPATVVCPKSGAPRFLHGLASRLTGMPSLLRLDIGEVTAIDYLSVQSLLVLARECRRSGAELQLLGVSENNRRRLRVSGLLEVLTIDCADPQLAATNRALAAQESYP